LKEIAEREAHQRGVESVESEIEHFVAALQQPRQYRPNQHGDDKEGRHPHVEHRHTDDEEYAGDFVRLEGTLRQAAQSLPPELQPELQPTSF